MESQRIRAGHVFRDYQVYLLQDEENEAHRGKLILLLKVWSMSQHHR